MLNPAEHMPLIYRVIGQMGLSNYEIEEAYSEGLVAITEAARTFDPDKGVPPAYWLAQNIRWSLNTWIAKERRRQSRHSPMGLEVSEVPFSSPYGFGLTIAQANTILSEEERLVLYALAWGYKGTEVAKRLGRSSSYVTTVKQAAQRKLRDAKILLP